MPSDRLAYALAHPLDTGRDIDIKPYQRVDGQPDGNLLLSTLAVDR